MPKIYTHAHKVVGENVVYLHTDDSAFRSNAENTTYKRGLVEDDGQPRVNYSYSGEQLPDDDDQDFKVYTIQRKLADGVYQQVNNEFYLTRIEATKALRAMGGGKTGTDKGLVIYSFIVN